MGKYGKLPKMNIPPLFSKKDRKVPIDKLMVKILRKNNKAIGF